MGLTSRASTTTGTVPASTALSGGTVTTDVNQTSALIYTGTDVLPSILLDTLCGKVGALWIYIASATPKIARILAVTPVDESNPAALIYAIILDRAMPSVSGATASYIVADLKRYYVGNQGGASGVFDEVAFIAGEWVDTEIQYPLNTEWLEAKTFNATGTTFLIREYK
jgi:hypothetical protein